MINFILLVLLLLGSKVLLKCTNSSDSCDSSDSLPLVIHFLNFVQLFHLQVLLITILPVSLVIFFPLQFLMITLAKILFLVSQIKNANLSKKCLVSYNVTSHFINIPLQETINIAINLISIHNPNLNITRKGLKKPFLCDT